MVDFHLKKGSWTKKDRTSTPAFSPRHFLQVILLCGVAFFFGRALVHEPKIWGKKPANPGCVFQVKSPHYKIDKFDTWGLGLQPKVWDRVEIFLRNFHPEVAPSGDEAGPLWTSGNAGLGPKQKPRKKKETPIVIAETQKNRPGIHSWYFFLARIPLAMSIRLTLEKVRWRPSGSLFASARLGFFGGWLGRKANLRSCRGTRNPKCLARWMPKSSREGTPQTEPKTEKPSLWFIFFWYQIKNPTVVIFAREKNWLQKWFLTKSGVADIRIIVFVQVESTWDVLSRFPSKH